MISESILKIKVFLLVSDVFIRFTSTWWDSVYSWGKSKFHSIFHLIITVECALSGRHNFNCRTSSKRSCPVSNKILSCFSETTDRNHKSCNQTMGEERTAISSSACNQSPAPSRTQRSETWPELDTRTLSEVKGRCAGRTPNPQPLPLKTLIKSHQGVWVLSHSFPVSFKVLCK